jgi:glutaredoxin 3
MAPAQPAPPPPPVAKVDFYSERFSADCMRAKAMLDRKGVSYNEFIIDSDDESRQVMLQRSGGNSSVPQIFINGRAIGGTEQLEALDVAGQLDVILGERPRDVHAEEAEAGKNPSQGGGRGLFALFGRS